MLGRTRRGFSVGARYGGAVVATLLALALRWPLEPVMGNAFVFATFYPTVALAAISAGGGPGLLATLLSIAVVWLWIGAGVPTMPSVINAGLFCASGCLVSIAAELWRRDRHRKLQAGQELGRRLFASSQDCIKVLDLDLNLLAMGEGGRKLMEIDDVRPYLNRPYLNFWNKEDWPKVQTALEAARAGGVGSFEGYSPSTTGKPRWWDVRITPMRDTHGQPERLLVIARDTTDAKLAGQALRSALDKLDRHMANSPLPIMEWEGDYHIISWNPSAENIFGWSASETRGLRIDALPLVYDEDWPKMHSMMAEMVNGTRPSNITSLRNIHKDGSIIECEWHNSALYDANGKLHSVLSVVADVTERNRIERDLAAAKLSAERAMASAESAAREAEQANRAKDHFLAVLSHELRTPLTPVLTAVTMMQAEPAFDLHTQESLQMIRRNVEMEARLIDDLLDVTRIARGKIELDRRMIPLGQVLRQTVEVCRGDLSMRDIHFQMNLGDAGDCLIEADTARLQQVFWNLLKNAIKFTPHGGRVWVRAHQVQPDISQPSPATAWIAVEVADSGQGIEAAILPQIFRAFEQGGVGVTRQFGGLGLGLAISKSLVELHGGTINVHSDGKGKGTTFTVVLPQFACKLPSAGPQQPSETVPEGKGMAPLRILLVEDHGDTAKVMRKYLIFKGHDVQVAGDVATALRLLETQNFDLLISDLGLPDGSGLDLMRRMRAHGQRVPGIALSGYGQDQDIRRSHEAGFVTHLTKPANPDRLSEAIAVVTSRPPRTPPRRNP